MLSELVTSVSMWISYSVLFYNKPNLMSVGGCRWLITNVSLILNGYNKRLLLNMGNAARADPKIWHSVKLKLLYIHLAVCGGYRGQNHSLSMVLVTHPDDLWTCVVGRTTACLQHTPPWLQGSHAKVCYFNVVFFI